MHRRTVWVGQSSGRVCQGGTPRLRLLWPLIFGLLTAVPMSSDVSGILNHSHAVGQTNRCLRARCTPSPMLLSGCWPHVERLTAANLAGVAAPAAAALKGVVIGLHGRFRSTNGTAVANGIALVFICTQLDRRLPSNSIIVCFISSQHCSSPILTDVLCHLFVQRTSSFLHIDNNRQQKAPHLSRIRVWAVAGRSPKGVHSNGERL